MANRIKGITVEIGGDTTGFDKALKGVNSTIKSMQSHSKVAGQAEFDKFWCLKAYLKLEKNIRKST